MVRITACRCADALADVGRPEKAGRPEALRRAAATKALKGLAMMHKLLGWKTDKDTISDVHPAHVPLLTGGGPNRTTPLSFKCWVVQPAQKVRGAPCSTSPGVLATWEARDQCLPGSAVGCIDDGIGNVVQMAKRET